MINVQVIQVEKHCAVENLEMKLSNCTIFVCLVLSAYRIVWAVCCKFSWLFSVHTSHDWCVHTIPEYFDIGYAYKYKAFQIVEKCIKK